MSIDPTIIEDIRKRVIADIIKNGRAGIFVPALIDEGKIPADGVDELIDAIRVPGALCVDLPKHRGDPVDDLVFSKGPNWSDLGYD